MKKKIFSQLLPFSFLCFLCVEGKAQNSKLLNSRWKTQETTVVQISEEHQTLVGRQINCQTEKYKPYNGKIVLKNLKQTSGNEFTGTLIDPATQKEYTGRFILADAGNVLHVKIKWGIFTFDREWTASK